MNKRARATPDQARAIRRVAAAVKPLLPKRTAVKVEVWSDMDVHAMVWRTGASAWRMRLRDSQNESEFEDSLIHEFAHVMAGTRCEPDGDHGPVWGVCFAECYRAVVEPKKGQA